MRQFCSAETAFQKREKIVTVEIGAAASEMAARGFTDGNYRQHKWIEGIFRLRISKLGNDGFAGYCPIGGFGDQDLNIHLCPLTGD
jgi:hypothetical protein